MTFKRMGIALIAAVSLMLGACQEGAKPDSTASAKKSAAPAVSSETLKAIDEAKAALSKVEKVGFAWRDTSKLIKKAEEAAKSGSDNVATKYAEEAKVQAELAWEQYNIEKSIDRSIK